MLLALLGAALLVAAALFIKPIKQTRRACDLDPADSLLDTRAASTIHLPTPLFSVFRPLAIDYLWIRADNLKQAGQYFDALHLARLICALQPHNDKVWDFQAWNMAYNISVSMPNPPERWRWIDAGIRLLRDEGLIDNPRSPKLYHTLAWIFQHKIGGISDDYHRYYKFRLAYDMMTVFGTDIVSNEQLAALAAAPASWDRLKNDPNIVALMEDIKKADPQLAGDEDLLKAVLRIKVNPNEYPPPLHQVLANHRLNPALGKLDHFVRARDLRREWKMDPRLMLQINQQYGPMDYQNDDKHLGLDWRLPWCHALYWAKRGLEFAPRDTKEQRDLTRAVYHNMISLYYEGLLQIFTVTAPAEDTERQPGQEILEKNPRTQLRIFNSQDLRMFPAAYQATLDVIKYLNDAGEEVPKGIESALSYLTWDALSNLYLTGYQKTAEKYYLRLRDRYPENQDYRVSLETFINKRLADELREITPKKAGDYIDSILRRSYAFAAVRNDDLAAAYEKRAEQIYRIFGESFADEQNIDRVKLPPFSTMRLLALQNFLDDPTVVPDAKGLLLARLRTEKPQEFDRIMNELQMPRRSFDAPPSGQ